MGTGAGIPLDTLNCGQFRKVVVKCAEVVGDRGRRRRWLLNNHKIIARYNIAVHAWVLLVDADCCSSSSAITVSI